MKVNKKEELEITGARLLSAYEAEKYLSKNERKYVGAWWLLSPVSDSSYRTTSVYSDGDICYYGQDVYSYGNTRPALQINNIESSNFNIGDVFEINGYEFRIISNNLAWMYKQDIGFGVFNFDDWISPLSSNANPSDYDESAIKRYIDRWWDSILSSH